MLGREHTWRGLIETAIQGIVNFHKEPKGGKLGGIKQLTYQIFATSAHYWQVLELKFENRKKINAYKKVLFKIQDRDMLDHWQVFDMLFILL